MTIDTLLFDLDGTITDSHEGIYKGMQYALAQMGCPVPEAKDLGWCIGPPLEDNFDQLIPDSTSEKVARGCALYHQYYAQEGLFQNAVYPHIEETLDTLHKAGYALFVATSKLEEHAIAVLQHFQLDHYFLRIHGATKDGRVSKKVDVIHEVVKANPINPSKTIMIGDHNVDIIGGKAHNMYTIGVLYGYGSEQELVEAKPDHLCKTPEMLLTTINQFINT